MQADISDESSKYQVEELKDSDQLSSTRANSI